MSPINERVACNPYLKGEMKMKKIAVTLFFIGLLASSGRANLEINDFNSTTLTVTFNITLESVATEPANNGLFTLSPFSDLSTDWITGAPSLTLNSITIGGVATSITMTDNASNSGDSLIFIAGDSDISPPAGSIITGTASFTGTFNTAGIAMNDFKLYQGYDSKQNVSNVIGTAMPALEPVSIFPAVEISWSTITGETYQVQYSTNLVSENWFNFGDAILGDGSTNNTFDSTQDSAKRFYRVINE